MANKRGNKEKCANIDEAENVCAPSRDQSLTLPGRRPGYPALLMSRNSLSVMLTINLSRHNDSDGLGYALCQLKLVLSISKSELRDVNRTVYLIRRPGSVKTQSTRCWDSAILCSM